jgi:hypothetical protein
VKPVVSVKAGVVLSTSCTVPIFYCDILGIRILFFVDDVSKDHTTMTAPLPVCSAKLSIVGPG